MAYVASSRDLCKKKARLNLPRSVPIHYIFWPYIVKWLQCVTDLLHPIINYLLSLLLRQPPCTKDLMDGMELLKLSPAHFAQMKQALHSHSIRALALLLLRNQNGSNSLIDFHHVVFEGLQVFSPFRSG